MNAQKSPAATNSEALNSNNLRNQYNTIAKVGLTGQPQRVTEFIYRHQGALTHHVAERCAVGNVSDACRRANFQLEQVGLRLVCRMPNPRIKNRFGQPSQVHKWYMVSTGGEHE